MWKYESKHPSFASFWVVVLTQTNIVFIWNLKLLLIFLSSSTDFKTVTKTRTALVPWPQANSEFMKISWKIKEYYNFNKCTIPNRKVGRKENFQLEKGNYSNYKKENIPNR